MRSAMIAAAVAVAIVQSSTGAAEAKTRAHQSQTKVLKKKVNKLQDQIATLRKQASTLDRQRTTARREVAALRRSLHIIPPSLLLASIKAPFVAPAAAFRDVPVNTVLLGSLSTETPRRAPEREPQPLIQPMRVVTRHALKALAGFPAPLVAKVEEIVSACGSRIASAHRPGARVAGSGRQSLHAIKRAVDVSGNPKCIYAHLRGRWPGGYSTDYWSAPGGRHVHISYSPRGREWGARFVHWHSGRAQHARLARKRHANAPSATWSSPLT